jgi:hypothetical protein
MKSSVRHDSRGCCCEVQAVLNADLRAVPFCSKRKAYVRLRKSQLKLFVCTVAMRALVAMQYSILRVTG